MRSIVEEANMTQAKVDVICKDIRAMDHAKRHLTQSISVLENFGTLTDALTDLKESSNDRCAPASRWPIPPVSKWCHSSGHRAGTSTLKTRQS